MHRLTTSFILGYHGCKAETAELLLSGGTFNPSDNEYDWLGPGVYFWQSNPKRALEFAHAKRLREKAEWQPAVVGAVIEPSLCLDLSTTAGVEHVKKSYNSLVTLYRQAGVPLPENQGGRDLLKRMLDCAVIRTLHRIREQAGDPPIDTVIGMFTEGPPIYANSGFYQDTHVQLCVCNPTSIKGVFRVSDEILAA